MASSDEPRHGAEASWRPGPCPPKGMPVLLAEQAGHGQVRAWCPFCRSFHHHGDAGGDPEGHRVARCVVEWSPFHVTGNLVKMRDHWHLPEVHRRRIAARRNWKRGAA